MTKVILYDRTYVPADEIDEEHVRGHYIKHFFDEAACRRCPYMESRPSFECDACSAKKESISLTKEKVIKGVRYIGLPIGDIRNFERVTGLAWEDVQRVDRRIKMPFDHKIRFTAKLRDYQTPLSEKMVKKGYGLLEAPPRTGKTITLLKTMLDLGYKFILLADQHEFLTQFMDHVYGNEKEGIPKCTNIPELERKLGHKLCGRPKTMADVKRFQIFVMPYQQFISKNGQKRFKKLFPHIGSLAVDEAHKVGALEFSRVVTMFPARHKIGVTGTVDRKDGKDWVLRRVVGPIQARTSVEALPVKVYVYRTPTPATQSKAWVYIMKHLCKNKARNKMIVDYAIKDLKAGRNLVIPVCFRDHGMELVRMINKAWGSEICKSFFGGGGEKNKAYRKQLLTDAKANKIRCIVGIRKLIQLGLNVPTWDTLYEIIPISNEPNLKQETSRIRTPMDGKKQPIIRWFVDMEVGASLGCARSSFNHMRKFKYEFAEKTRDAYVEVMQAGNRRRRGSEEEGPLFEDEAPVNLLKYMDKKSQRDTGFMSLD